MTVKQIRNRPERPGPHLSVDDAGGISAADSARPLLQKDPGPFRLVPSAPGLLVALRDHPFGLEAEIARFEPGPVVMAGELGELQPSDLLNFLHQGRRTGILLTRSGAVDRVVVLLEGTVAWAASSSPSERFGELLCRSGLLRRSVLETALQAQLQAHDHRPIGQLLGERGLLEPEDLWRGLRTQVIEIFLGLLVVRSGCYLFYRGVRADLLPAQLAIDVEALLLDGLRRIDEMEYYRQRIESSSVVLHATGKAEPSQESAEFTPQMRKLLALVDGVTMLERLAEDTALGEFEATKAAFHLMRTGHVRPEGSADVQVHPVDVEDDDSSPFERPVEPAEPLGPAGSAETSEMAELAETPEIDEA